MSKKPSGFLHCQSPASTLGFMATLKRRRRARSMIRFATVCLVVFFLSSTLASALSSIIDRTRREQLISSLSSSDNGGSSGISQQFVASPSGRYGGLFVRQTAADSQSYGHDYCYIQIVGSGQILWESECAPVSTTNRCYLVFSDFGLEIYDGGRSVWDTNADGVKLQTLMMLDNGDLQIRDEGDQVAWKASDYQSNSHRCSTSSYTPYASPLPSNDPQPAFNQPYNQQPLNQPYSSVNQPFSSTNQQPFGNGIPLIHNPLFGSGSTREVPSPVFLLIGLFVLVLSVYGFDIS
ncbi:uncharacterized protein LOC116248267 [Nymphaea colorata]|uniref:Bulb-type lectin domain-containing protein n=1 Tax=Nymphaea colorata TaxID=210225 RepID=A0A5K1AZQ5_9MAGN|nr:uncharacterized protein LOC116248267 [Nymphaea colorata]